MTNIILTPEQNECVNTISALFKTGSSLMTIIGRAGTGKTTIVRSIIEELGMNFDTNVAFVAYTGKAALVLRQKGNPASTIHSLIYNSYKDKFGNFHSKLKKELEGFYRVIVIDEISMVDQDLLEDVMSFGVPVIALGDDAQLPPIYKNKNQCMENPDFRLTQIHRQAAENTIIKFSDEIANKNILTSKYNDSYIRTVGKDELSMSMLNWADQIICSTHAVRKQFNAMIREDRGFTSKYPEVGDKVICQQNYKDVTGDNGDFLVNGMTGHIYQILDSDYNSFNPWMEVVFKPEYDTDAIFNFRIDLSPFDGKKEYWNRKNTAPNQIRCSFDFGYAITGYKSQGSEWDKVLVYAIDAFGEKKKHLYTMLTRAAKQVVWVQVEEVPL